MALLEIAGVSKRFGGLAALDGVDLAIEQGSIHAVIGPNGAGKSTLINVLTGYLTPDTGTVAFDGQSLLGLPPFEINQRGIARVFQTPEIFPEMTLVENVGIAALAARDGSFRANFFEHQSRLRAVREKAEAVLTDVGLKAHFDTEARHLARGDKRRLELAICLAHEPRLLLLDEPTAGMSQHDTQGTVELLRRISRTGMTKLIIEHDMGVVFSLSERITVLHQGRVIASGPPEEIRGNALVQEAYLGGAHL
ncbi:MAG: ABC transporter ATP-binding protein [Xanthobacteraceae bacterium]